MLFLLVIIVAALIMIYADFVRSRFYEENAKSRGALRALLIYAKICLENLPDPEKGNIETLRDFEREESQFRKFHKRVYAEILLRKDE